jgi:hypothetical protein
MAKLMSMFLVLIAIQACLILYAGQTAVPTDIWNYVTNTDYWNSLNFISTLAAIAAGIGLVGIGIASAFGFKTDFLIFAPAVAGFISMGVVFVNLANVMRDEMISRVFIGCDVGNCAPATFILGITIAPLALYYTWTIIEWWRGKDY